jgi:hypothetical protein
MGKKDFEVCITRTKEELETAHKIVCFFFTTYDGSQE